MFSAPVTAVAHCSYAPIFPPLPVDGPSRPPAHPLPIYCPTAESLINWMDAVCAGDVSVGHGPGSAGNEGTAQDRGTVAPGSNLTGQQTVPSEPRTPRPDRAQDADDDEDHGLLEGTQHGPAQPH